MGSSSPCLWMQMQVGGQSRPHVYREHLLGVSSGNGNGVADTWVADHVAKHTHNVNKRSVGRLSIAEGWPVIE